MAITGPIITLGVASVSIAVTVMLLSLNLSTTLGGYGAANIFAYHPVFMCLAFLLFIPLGIMSYTADFGERGNAIYPDKESRRLIHGLLTLIAVFLVLSGYLVAFVYHEAKGIDHLALHTETWTRPAHVFIGFIALGGIVIQGGIGLYKYVVATRDNINIVRHHGMIGPIIWLCGLLCICLAGYFEYLEGAGHWTIGQAASIWIGIAILAFVVTLFVRKGNRDHILVHEYSSGETEGFIKRGNLIQ